MASTRLEPNVHVLLSSFAVRGRCLVRLMDDEPSDSDKQRVVLKSELLVLVKDGLYQLGFGVEGEYRQLPIVFEEVLCFLRTYRPGDFIHQTKHTDSINALLPSELRLTVPVMNMVIYVEGGPSPILHSFVKYTASKLDIDYSESPVPFQLYSNGDEFDSQGIHPEFTTLPMVIIPSNGFFEFKTYGGARCSVAVDICLDHVTQHSMVLFLRRVFSENTPMALLPVQIEHCITSNTVMAIPEHRLARHMLQVDPQKSPFFMYPSAFGEHVMTDKDLKMIAPKPYAQMFILEKDIGYAVLNPPFGHEYMVEVLDERPCMRYRSGFDDMIGSYNQKVRDRFFSGGQRRVPQVLLDKKSSGVWDFFFNPDSDPVMHKTEHDENYLIRLLQMEDTGGRSLLHWCAKHMDRKPLLKLLFALSSEQLIRVLFQKDARGDTIAFEVFARVPEVIEKVWLLMSNSERLLLLQTKNNRRQLFLELCFEMSIIMDTLLATDELLPLLQPLLKTASDVKDLLKGLSAEQISRHLLQLRPLLLPVIHSRVDLVMVMQHLGVEERVQLCRWMVEALSFLILSRADLMSVCSLLREEGQVIVIEELNRKHTLGDMVNIRYDLKKLLAQMPSSHHSMLMNAITRNNGWRRFIDSSKTLSLVLKTLPKALTEHPAMVKLTKIYFVSAKATQGLLPSGRSLNDRIKKMLVAEGDSSMRTVRDGPTPS